jgi:predicted anti-sigma-YlaC factor YlaD
MTAPELEQRIHEARRKLGEALLWMVAAAVILYAAAQWQKGR